MGLREFHIRLSLSQRNVSSADLLPLRALYKAGAIIKFNVRIENRGGECRNYKGQPLCP